MCQVMSNLVTMLYVPSFTYQKGNNAINEILDSKITSSRVHELMSPMLEKRATHWRVYSGLVCQHLGILSYFQFNVDALNSDEVVPLTNLYLKLSITHIIISTS